MSISIQISLKFILKGPVASGLFYWHGLTLIPAWISNYMPGKVWDEIAYDGQFFDA